MLLVPSYVQAFWSIGSSTRNLTPRGNLRLYPKGLLRSSGNHKALADFMDRDFTDSRHKAAAAKNAYVLLGKHRYELAAAMFVLAGSLQEALAVCSKQVG